MPLLSIKQYGMNYRWSVALTVVSTLLVTNVSADNWSPWNNYNNNNNNNGFNPSFRSNYGAFNRNNQPFNFNQNTNPFGFNTGTSFFNPMNRNNMRPFNGGHNWQNHNFRTLTNDINKQSIKT